MSSSVPWSCGQGGDEVSVPRSHGFIESSHVDQTHSAPRRTCRPLEGRVARQQTREAPDCRRRRIARRAYLRCSHPCDWSSDRRARTVSGRNARSDTHQRPIEPRCVLVSRQRSRLRIEWIPQKEGKAGRYGISDCMHSGSGSQLSLTNRIHPFANSSLHLDNNYASALHVDET